MLQIKISNLKETISSSIDISLLSFLGMKAGIDRPTPTILSQKGQTTLTMGGSSLTRLDLTKEENIFLFYVVKQLNPYSNECFLNGSTTMTGRSWIKVDCG